MLLLEGLLGLAPGLGSLLVIMKNPIFTWLAKKKRGNRDGDVHYSTSINRTLMPKSAVKPMYICLSIAWVLFLVLNFSISLISYRFILVTQVLAIICFTEDEQKNGVISLCLILLGTPLVYWIRIHTLARYLLLTDPDFN